MKNTIVILTAIRAVDLLVNDKSAAFFALKNKSWTQCPKVKEVLTMRKKVLIVTASVVAGAAALMALGRYIKGPLCLFEDDEEEEYEPDEEFDVDLGDEGTPDPLGNKRARIYDDMSVLVDHIDDLFEYCRNK